MSNNSCWRYNNFYKENTIFLVVNVLTGNDPSNSNVETDSKQYGQSEVEKQEQAKVRLMFNYFDYNNFIIKRTHSRVYPGMITWHGCKYNNY